MNKLKNKIWSKQATAKKSWNPKTNMHQNINIPTSIYLQSHFIPVQVRKASFLRTSGKVEGWEPAYIWFIRMHSGDIEVIIVFN